MQADGAARDRAKAGLHRVHCRFAAVQGQEGAVDGSVVPAAVMHQRHQRRQRAAARVGRIGPVADVLMRRQPRKAAPGEVGGGRRARGVVAAVPEPPHLLAPVSGFLCRADAPGTAMLV